MQFVPSSSLAVYPHLFLTSIPPFSLVAKSTGSASKGLMRKKRYINKHIQYTDRIGLLSVGSRDLAIKQGGLRIGSCSDFGYIFSTVLSFYYSIAQ